MSSTDFVGFAISVVSNVVNILAHSLGLYLLRRADVTRHNDVHMAYVTNLSTAELVANLFSLIQHIFKTTAPSLMLPTTLSQITAYADIVCLTVVDFNMWMTMTYVIIDRWLRAVSSAYPYFWKTDKTLFLIIATWTGSFLVCAGTAAYLTVFRQHFGQFFIVARDVKHTWNLILIITAVVSHGCIFHQFRKSFRRQKESTRGRAICTVFRHSRFYLSLIIVATFMLLVLIPDTLRFYWSKPDDVIDITHRALPGLAHFIHACAYVLVYEKTKQLLCRDIRSVLKYVCYPCSSHSPYSTGGMEEKGGSGVFPYKDSHVTTLVIESGKGGRGKESFGGTLASTVHYGEVRETCTEL